MPSTTQNLGQVQSIHVGLNPPTNTSMVWFDTNPTVMKHKYYDTVNSAWVLLQPGTTIAYGFPFVFLAQGNTVAEANGNYRLKINTEGNLVAEYYKNGWQETGSIAIKL